MRGEVTEVKALSYARVIRLTLKVSGGDVSLEIPQRVLEEVGWDPKPGEKVEVYLSRGLRRDGWEIVYSGKVYLKKGDRVYLSFGGLIGTVSVKRYLNLGVGEKVYMGLKRIKE